MQKQMLPKVKTDLMDMIDTLLEKKKIQDLPATVMWKSWIMFMML